jgi:predicted lipid-binding transport protein (Tim44 family)
MQRSVVLSALVAMLLATFIWTLDAWARVGGGGSSGSRGSRSFSAPANPGSSPSSPGRQAAPPSSFQRPAPQRSGWMSGLMGGIGGFLLGGLIGSMLFGGMGGGLGGLFGGIGLIEILLIAGVLYFVYSYMRRRQQPAPASSYGYTAAPRESDTGYWQAGSTSAPSATIDMPEATSDLERGLEHIRQMDAAFDPRRFSDTASDIFFKLQAAWMARDITAVRDLLTPELAETLQKDCERLRAEHRIDRMENIAVRSVDVTEAWQENGRDYVTVRFLANMLDYTVDERTDQVLKGSRSEPVKFEEYWTFVRPVGPNPWRLSAIQQAA